MGGERNLELDGPERTLKPMLSACIEQALHLALIDCATPPQNPDGETIEEKAGLWTDEQRAKLEEDIYAIPAEALAGMDARALAQRLSHYLLGPGGWVLPTPNGPLYTGNATTSEVFEATFDRSDRDHTAEVAFDLLQARPEEDSHA